MAYKGQRYMIQALARLIAKGNTRYEYHLAGGGDSTTLTNLAAKLNVSDQVIFDGVLRHDQMFTWFDELDMYIQPSIVEAMPRALIEAMSRGLPALGSIVGGIPELLGDDSVFPRKGVKEICQLLERCTQERMLTMAQNNYKTSKQFQKELLEQRRYDFYAAFAEETKKLLK